jgi:hypothetical protein
MEAGKLPENKHEPKCSFFRNEQFVRAVRKLREELLTRLLLWR